MAPEGAIWRIPPDGVAELWYQDAEFLGGLGQIPNYVPLGANGISFRHNALYVANTEKGHIARIPVLPDGSPGEPSIVAQAVFDGVAEIEKLINGLQSMEAVGTPAQDPKHQVELRRRRPGGRAPPAHGESRRRFMVSRKCRLSGSLSSASRNT